MEHAVLQTPRHHFEYCSDVSVTMILREGPLKNRMNKSRLSLICTNKFIKCLLLEIYVVDGHLSPLLSCKLIKT